MITMHFIGWNALKAKINWSQKSFFDDEKEHIKNSCKRL